MKRYFSNNYILLAISFCLISFVWLFKYNYSSDYKSKAAQFESVLSKRISELENNVKILSKKNIENTDSLFIDYKNSDLFHEKGISLFVSKNDSLIFWSNNLLPEINLNELTNKDIIKLKNGWYYTHKESLNNSSKTTLIGLSLIKKEHLIKNDYLSNDYHPDINLPSNCNLLIIDSTSVIDESTTIPVYKNSNQDIVLIDFDKHKFKTSGFYLKLFLFILGVMLLLLTLPKVICSLLPNRYSNLGLVFSIILLIILRLFLTNNSIPDVLYSFSLFESKYYASSHLLPSLGDLLLHSLLILYFVVLIFKKYKVESKNIKDALVYVVITALFLSVLLIVYWFKNTINGLIINSTIHFDLNNIYEIDWFTIVGISILGILLFSFYLLTSKSSIIVTNILKQKGYSGNNILLNKYFIGSSLLAVIGFLAFQHLLYNICFVTTLFGIVIIWLISFYSLKKSKMLTFVDSVIVLIIFSLFSTFIFQKYNSQKEVEWRKLYVEELGANKDPMAEYKFLRVEEKISSDTSILILLNNYSENELEVINILEKEHLKGFEEKYNYSIFLCSSNDSLFIEDKNTKEVCNNFFNDLISQKGISTLSDNLWLLDNYTGRINYLANIPVNSSKGAIINIYIEFDSKFIMEKNGFPEILLNQNQYASINDTKYSYAKYKDGKLVNNLGDFTYNLTSDDYETDVETGTYIISSHGFNHVVYKTFNEKIIVLSKVETGIYDYITSFSYLFSFLGLIIFSVFIVVYYTSSETLFLFTLKTKIQTFIIFVLIASMIFVGAGTLYFFYYQNQNQNNHNIREKAKSVLIELEHKLSDVEEFNPGMNDYVYYLLNKFSNVFFTDITLYDLDGKLISSSRPEIFEEGLLSNKMNNNAYCSMVINNSSELIHKETIGNMSYLSAYMPFRNKKNQILAYMNLPYFAKQAQMQNELSNLIVAIINIYVLLIMFSLVVVIIVTNRLTTSLKIIENSIRNVKLGKPNSKISWTSNDEVGGLINEYNRMIDEISVSAKLLAKSERETAWREMAKQVAHEIKNPLTPMKLRTQYLQQSLNQDDPDWKDKLSDYTKTIIQQIETLSSIATEFSNFAKMPKPQNTDIDLKEFINSITDLFKNYENLNIDTAFADDEPYIVNADKELLLRVFNNLINNAIHAIEEKEEKAGLISIHISKDSSSIKIEIKDNGIGIEEDKKDKIFSYSFTTKSSGSGLGLVMVKSIIESFNGEINFESQINQGTTFTIKLPVQ